MLAAVALGRFSPRHAISNLRVENDAPVCSLPPHPTCSRDTPVLVSFSVLLISLDLVAFQIEKARDLYLLVSVKSYGRRGS
jgi:hypothetical protein